MSDRVELARLSFLQLNKTERRDFLAQFSGAPVAAHTAPAAPRILRRGEVARMLARSPRAVDRMAVDGILAKVRLPGRPRAAGFRESDVVALIGARE